MRLSSKTVRRSSMIHVPSAEHVSTFARIRLLNCNFRVITRSVISLLHLPAGVTWSSRAVRVCKTFLAFTYSCAYFLRRRGGWRVRLAPSNSSRCACNALQSPRHSNPSPAYLPTKVPPHAVLFCHSNPRISHSNSRSQEPEANLLTPIRTMA